MVFGFTVSPAPGVQEVIVLFAKTTETFKATPAMTFLGKPVKISLRSNGITKSFNAVIDSSRSSYDETGVSILDQKLIEMLHGPGQWDVLIKGDGWYFRTKVYGNCPK
jgi:hypothetical protein